MTDTSGDGSSYGQPWTSPDSTPDSTADHAPGTTASTSAVHPLDEQMRERTPVAPKPRSRASAHIGSVVLSLLLVPAALVLLDYGYREGYARFIATNQDTQLPTTAIICLGIAGGLLAIVGAISRMSGLGPLLAGLVWGVAPTVLLMLDPSEFARRIVDLPDVYDQFGFALTSFAGAALPIIGGVLVGCGLFGRWRR